LVHYRRTTPHQAPVGKPIMSIRFDERSFEHAQWWCCHEK
jgi:hypothetical protein